MWEWTGFSWWWFVMGPFGMLGFWALVIWAFLPELRPPRSSLSRSAEALSRVRSVPALPAGSPEGHPLWLTRDTVRVARAS